MAGPVHVGRFLTPSANFTRPADTTAYASGDLVANSTTAADVDAMSWDAGNSIAGSFAIRRARLFKSDDDTANATFRLHLFSADPVSTAPANGDNGALSLNTAITGYLGTFTLDMTTAPDLYNTAGNSVIAAPLVGEEITVKLDSGRTIYGLLEARAAYAPGESEVFTVVLEVWQNA